MSVLRFTRQVSRYRRAMTERITRRIEQLQQEKEELRLAAMLRDKEIDGQIQALRDVLTAIANEQPVEAAS